MPRTLAAAPATFLDPSTGEPAFGSYAGSLPPITTPGLGLVDRVARRKRWVYVAISSQDLWIALAVVRTGYAATAFAFVYDLSAGRMLVDRTAMAPTFAADVSDDPGARGSLASFAFSGTELDVARGGEGISLRARVGELDVEATLDDRSAPPGIAAIARLGGSLFDATEKRALAIVRGRARVAGREISLDGATAGWDYTHGLLPRHTRWRWAFALGKDEDGEPLAFNLVSGFVGEAECAAFTRAGVHPLEEPRFEFDGVAPERPWRLVGEGLELAFTPGAIHAQRTNLGVVRSRFLQPVGTYSGVVRVGDRDHRVSGLPGVVEDQDVLW